MGFRGRLVERKTVAVSPHERSVEVFFERRVGKNKRKTKYNTDDNRVLLQHPLYIVLVFPWLVFRHSVGVLDTACRWRYSVLSAPSAQCLHRQDVLDESWKGNNTQIKKKKKERRSLK